MNIQLRLEFLLGTFWDQKKDKGDLCSGIHFTFGFESDRFYVAMICTCKSGLFLSIEPTGSKHLTSTLYFSIQLKPKPKINIARLGITHEVPILAYVIAPE